MIRKISKRQFDAYCYVRQPLIRAYSREVSWFEAGEKKLLAICIFDKTDQDFGYIILGRDARKLFRCIEVSPLFFLTVREAESALHDALKNLENDGEDIYPQGDEVLATNEIFNPIVPEEKQHPYFKILASESRFEPARNLIREIAYSFIDIDGNYIQQFQSDGFDARLWELFLYVYLYNSGFEIDRAHSSPDYCLNRFGDEVYIEAVTVGPSPDFDDPQPKSGKEVLELAKDYVPIKYGSALFTKLSKKPHYWELPHVKDKPFILAIHDYHKAAEKHAPGSMAWTRAGLSNYLYGRREEVEIDQDGKAKPVFLAPFLSPVIKRVKTKEHIYKHKKIPSNFFEQPNSEHISAVLFSNGATLTTFNRMGKLGGLGGKDIKMIRTGVRVNLNPEEFEPIPFVVDVDDENYSEAWADTVVMYHNPKALQPVNPDMFPDISHVFFNEHENDFITLPNPNEILSSTTMILSSKDPQKDEK
jgi:hypothetical protein